VAGFPFACAFARRPPKKISAICVKNEVEFLERSINSVIDLVDELIIIDDCSVDGTADVLADFSRRFPKKVRPFEYPYEVARYGEETLMLAATKEGKKYPSFLPNCYAQPNARGPLFSSGTATRLQRMRSQRPSGGSGNLRRKYYVIGINLHPDLRERDNGVLK
jgi:glycosyltransferase involved in cell wall biosynthesis